MMQRAILATALLLLDFLYIAADVVHLGTNSPGEPSSAFSDVHWNGDLDGSFAEIFGHTQLIGGAVALVFLSVRRRSSTYLAWVAVLLALVADDFLQLHELVGARLVGVLGLTGVLGVPAQDLGEVLVWSGFALVLGVALVASYARSTEAERAHSRLLAGRLGILAAFAVGVDQVSSVLDSLLPFVLQVALTLVETSGELVAMTCIVLAVHRMTLEAADRVRDRNRDREGLLVRPQ